MLSFSNECVHAGVPALNSSAAAADQASLVRTTPAQTNAFKQTKMSAQ
jgi:hypothetical protein